MTKQTELRCVRCHETYALNTKAWRCSCGGPLEIKDGITFSRDQIRTEDLSLWRYRDFLPVEDEAHVVSLGEGFTPIVDTALYGLQISFKLEFFSPTGSFKDRGTTVLVSALREMGVDEVVEDSSGNAAASLAAYCARGRIKTHIFVPAYASQNKLTQIGVYGANIVEVEGPREAAAEAAKEEAAEGTYYASHYYSAFPMAGLKTFAYEVCEQRGWKAPDNLVFPVGHGTFLLGAHRGFTDLVEAEVIDHMPRLFAVQAERCAPLADAFLRKREEPSPARGGETVAEGIRIVNPVRGREILHAIRDTGGMVITVGEGEIRRAQEALARLGLYVEPTSAAGVAGIRKLDKMIEEEESTVVPLTGSGLKDTRGWN